jgi:hypothetical protein
MHKKSLSSSSGFLPYSDVVLIDISAWLEVEERERERERERDRVADSEGAAAAAAGEGDSR